MTPEDRELFSQINKSLSSLSGLPRSVERIESQTDRIDKTLREKQIADAKMQGENETTIENMEGDINGIGKKIGLHINDHWKWLVLTFTLVGVIIGAAGFLSKSKSAQSMPSHHIGGISAKVR